MRAALIGIALLALAGCSTAIRGRGTLDGNLHCASGAVTDRAAPFCYALPSGFTDNTAQRAHCGRWRYCTIVSVARHDLVQVLAARAPFDSDGYSEARLQAEAESSLSAVARAAQSTLSDVSALRVAGVRAYQQTVLTLDGTTERAIVAYRGHTAVFIQCDEQDRIAAAREGCARVLATIQIVALP